MCQGYLCVSIVGSMCIMFVLCRLGILRSMCLLCSLFCLCVCLDLFVLYVGLWFFFSILTQEPSHEYGPTPEPVPVPKSQGIPAWKPCEKSMSAEDGMKAEGTKKGNGLMMSGLAGRSRKLLPRQITRPSLMRVSGRGQKPGAREAGMPRRPLC